MTAPFVNPWAAPAAPPHPDHPVTLDPRPLVYDGRSSQLFRIHLGNLGLALVTLGLYRFWGKVRIRRYVWAHASFARQRFEYTGTGGELFRGFLKAMAVLLPLIGLSMLIELAAFAGSPALLAATKAVQITLLVYLVYVGTFAARRYQMSRTRWSGIRLHLAGSPWRYGGIALGGLLLTVLTLGVYSPYMQMRLKRMELGGLHVGTLPFRFEGQGRDLLKPFLLALLLTVPTLGLVWFWYAARRTRYVAERTSLGGLSFALPEVGGGELFWLVAGNWLIMILSLGLFYPVTVHRRMRFWADHLLVSGQLDPTSIGQIAASRADGEGLAGFFGLDTFAA